MKNKNIKKKKGGGERGIMSTVTPVIYKCEKFPSVDTTLSFCKSVFSFNAFLII